MRGAAVLAYASLCLTPWPAKEGQEMLQARELRFPAAHGAAHGQAAVALQPMEEHGDAEIHQEGRLTLRRLLARTSGLVYYSRFPDGICHLVRDPH